MAWIEERGAQHRVYWRTTAQRHSATTYEPFATQADAQQFIALIAVVGPERARAFVRQAVVPAAPTGPDPVRATAAPTAVDAGVTSGQGEAPEEVPTLTLLLERYVERKKDARPRTLQDYKRDFENHIAPYFGAQRDARTLQARGPLSPVPAPAEFVEGSGTTIADWLVWLNTRQGLRKGLPNGKTLEPKTICGLHALLSGILEVAVTAEPPVLQRNPCTGSKLPKARTPEMHFLEHHAAGVLLAQFTGAWHTLVLLLLATGLRWGEAAGLQVGDLHLDAGTPFLDVRRAWARDLAGTYVLGRPKTDSSIRTVSLPASVVEELRGLVAGRAADEHVFRMPQGGRLHHGNFLARVFRPAVRRAAVICPDVDSGLRIHDLRHTNASWLLAAGRPINSVAARLGHASILTTMRYLHRLQGMDQKDADALEDILGPNMAPLSPAQRDALTDPALPILAIDDSDDLAA